MLYATNRFPGDGTTTKYEISFVGGYLDRSHVKAYVESPDLVRTPVAINPANFLGPHTIKGFPVVPVGSTLVIYRDTPKNPIVDFVNGSRFTEANLDTATRQGTFIAAEGADAGQVTSSIAQAAIAAQQAAIAAQQAAIATEAAQDAQASAGAIGAAVLAYDTYAAASAAAATLPDGQVVETVVNDASLQYVVSSGAIVKIPARAGDDTLNVRQFITSNIDGVTSNQAGIESAVDAAYAAGADLWWPPGLYVSTANIPNLHNIRHCGPGAIKRGEDLFYVQPEWDATTTNRLYVSTAGVVGNDGLSASQPMPTVQAAFNALMHFGPSIGGTWEVNLAAGTYNQFGELSDLRSKNRIRILGPVASGGVPTAIIDGTGLTAQSLNGILLSNGIYGLVRDIKFYNWHGGSGVGAADASTGLNVVLNCDVWADNCDFDLCGTGLSATRSRIYQGKGRVTGCDVGSTAFGNTTCSFGYGGGTTYTGLSFAINIRDGSAGVVDGGVITNCGTGIRCIHQSHTRVSNVTFSGSATSDVYLYTGSACFFGTGNTHTAGRKLRGEFALDLEAASQFYYNGDTDRFNFGTLGTPGYKFHFRNGASTGALVANTASLAVEADSPQIGLNGGGTGTFGLLCAIPGTSTAASLLYTATDGNWRIRVNNIDAYRIANTAFRAVTDNAVSLGITSTRFSATYSRQFFPGTGTNFWTSGAGSPEGILSAPVGSMYTRTDGAAGTTLYVKETGTGNTGWVAK